MKYIFLVCCCTVLLFGCRPIPANVNAQWTTLTITSEEQTEIILYPDNDTATVKIYDSGAFSFFAQPKKHKIDTLKVIFNSGERLKIFRLASDIVATPAKLIHHCSDFVGDLDINIYYGETCTQSIKYSGVCNWNTLSNKTQALHDILKVKMKKVFLGEDVAGRSHVGN
jgi:hypothetical protein